MRSATLTCALALVLAAATASAAVAAERGPGPRTSLERAFERGPVAPLGSSGRWLTDAAGRIVLLHGVNQVSKSAPYFPAAFGFGADDARFLARQGLNTVRLGVVPEGLMPQPGRVDETYIDAIERSVDQLARRRIFVLLDFHQDGYGPKYGGNGMPEWISIDDGLPNPDVPFPQYYFGNPALQRAFESFWANRDGPGGVGLQDHYLRGVRAVARRFADEPYVFGYDLMNEPFPGAAWAQCPTGCPDLERELLAPFYRRGTRALRRIAPDQQVYVEPFLLFNVGLSPTTVPGRGGNRGLSTHSYAGSESGRQGVVDHAVEAAERDRAPLVMTEFGATNDGPALDRLTDGFDREFVPWQFWAYNENLIEPGTPASIGTVEDLETLEALVRPYPTALAGTPRKLDFDPDARKLRLRYRTRSPEGKRYRRSAETVVAMPRLTFPDGYRVRAKGARVTSKPNAKRLTLRTRRGAARVRVSATPRGG